MTPHVPTYRVIAFLRSETTVLCCAGLVTTSEYGLTPEKFPVSDVIDAFVFDNEPLLTEMLKQRVKSSDQAGIEKAYSDAYLWLCENGKLPFSKVEDGVLSIDIDLCSATASATKPIPIAA